MATDDPLTPSMTTVDETSVPRARFSARRAAVQERLGAGVMLLPAAPVQRASRDTERRYVPDRELYYLTGLVEPEALAVLVAGAEPRTVVFVRDRDPDAELWTGPRLGPEAASELVGVEQCFGLSELEERLPGLLASADRIHVRQGRSSVVDRFVLEALERARLRRPRTGVGPRGVVDPGEILDDLRLVKDGDELTLLRRACALTAEGHRAGAAAIAPGVGEWVVEAAIDGRFRALGGSGPGFPTIVGAGKNACVLHYVDNDDVIGADDLVLVDAGADLGLYHGDVTRTYPASGSFTAEQLEVYQLVESALRAGIEAARPGSTISAVHDAVVAVLVRGLVDLGVLDGSVDGLVEAEAHRAFFPHQTSHWLGLDVHDPGDYARDGIGRTLEPGMVFTVEPGLYFRPALVEGRAVTFSGIGVRIEDDVAITSDGCEVLTSSIPKGAAEVAEMVTPAS